MRVYTATSYEQEFDVYETLRLMPDGSFSYFRSYSSYGGGFVYEAHGTWRQTGGTIYFLPEKVDKNINGNDWTEGRERTCAVYHDFISFNIGEEMYLVREGDSPENNAG